MRDLAAAVPAGASSVGIASKARNSELSTRTKGGSEIGASRIAAPARAYTESAARRSRSEITLSTVWCVRTRSSDGSFSP
jgi:hypothetical protein